MGKLSRMKRVLRVLEVERSRARAAVAALEARRGRMIRQAAELQARVGRTSEYGSGIAELQVAARAAERLVAQRAQVLAAVERFEREELTPAREAHRRIELRVRSIEALLERWAKQVACEAALRDQSRMDEVAMVRFRRRGTR